MGDTGYDKNYGCGIINICDAVKTAYNTPTADMPTSVKLSSSSVTTVKGDTCKISASVKTLGQNKGVYYHTEDSGIARVSQDGTITGVSDGETKLLASFGEDMTKNYYEDTDLVNGVTYTYTLKLFTEYKGVEYSEITSTLVVDYLDDDPLDTNLGKCEITGAEFTNNSVRLTCVSPAQCSVQQCLCSDNNGKSWFDVLNSIGSGENTFYIDKLEFGMTYLLKYKGFENALFGLYRDRSEYSDTITLTMPTELESPVIEAHTVNSAEVNIKWNATADADYYTVYRKNVGVWQKLADSVTGTSYCDSTITSGKIYYYKVVANKKSPDFRATKSNGESIVTNTGAQQSGDSNTVLINTNAEISKKHLMCAEVTPIPEQTYTGSAVCPQINAYFDGVPLAKGRDYTLEYVSNTGAGTGYAVLSGIGDYDGRYIVSFAIADKTEYKSYTVTYKDYDGSIIKTQTVKEGETPSKMQAPYREGYAFERWDKPVGKVYEDITLTAIYSYAEKIFNVAFLDKDGNVLDRQRVTYGESAENPNVPEYEGYCFAHWSEDTSYITKSIAVKPVYRAESFAGGDGTENSPYLISNREQLDLFSSLVNSSDEYAGASYRLTADIMYNDLADCEHWGNDNRTNEVNNPEHIWTPAGTEQRPFGGNFDGNGHTITGLYVFTSSDYAGFLGYARNADILCLKLESAYIKTEKGFAGAVAGKFENTPDSEHKIQACCVSDSAIIANGISGGIAGEFESNRATNGTVMSNCYSEGCYVYSLWDSIAGGLAGSVVSNGGTMEIRYCYAYDEILLNYGNEQMQAGKLIGSFKTTYDNNAFCKLNNCYYDADNIPVSGYEELCQNEGAYSFTDLTGFGDKNAKTIAANYSLKKYSSDDSSPELGDNVWILSDGDVPKLYFEKEKYAISYYLDDELVSIKYYRKGDKAENPERYYRNDYISTDWEFSEDDFDGIMPEIGRAHV